MTKEQNLCVHAYNFYILSSIMYYVIILILYYIINIVYYIVSL